MNQPVIRTKEEKQKESKEEEKRELSWAKELELPAGFEIVLAKIKTVQEAPFFDLKSYLPLDQDEAGQVVKDLEKLQKQVETMKKLYDPKDVGVNLEELGKMQKILKTIREKYVLSVDPINESERWFERYALYMIDEGILVDKEYSIGAKKLLEAPEDIEHNYAVIKKLVGEYLSRAVMARELVVDEELAKTLSQEGVQLKVGAPLYDRIMKNIFILKLVPMDESFKDGIRYGRIEDRSDVYGFVQGELDCIFVFIDPQTTKYLPTIVLEAKGGALSSASVSKQKTKEEDRLDLVREKPGQYALATRAQLNKGPFKDISRQFDLSHPSLELGLPSVLTIGPTRKGDQQFDIQLNMTPEQIMLLARYLVYTQKLLPRKFED